MRLHFKAETVSELTDYPPALRKLFLKNALEHLRANSRLWYWLPTILSFIGAVLGWLVVAPVIAGLSRSYHLHDPFDGMLTGLAAAFISGFIAGFAGLQLQIRKLRPCMRKAIELFMDKMIHAPPSLPK
jgi:UDP-N-acetylmuramyl pentapeptide phosphotransferase/UDP-N-acetylglucosamine-1-phosphate transferase